MLMFTKSVVVRSVTDASGARKGVLLYLESPTATPTICQYLSLRLLADPLTSPSKILTPKMLGLSQAKLFDEEMEVLHVTQEGKFTGDSGVSEENA